LKKAIETQLEPIKYAIKKPIFPMKDKSNFVNIAKDNGDVNGEAYEIYLTHPHFLVVDESLKVNF
jgi:hypothetical protein